MPSVLVLLLPAACGTIQSEQRKQQRIRDGAEHLQATSATRPTVQGPSPSTKYGAPPNAHDVHTPVNKVGRATATGKVAQVGGSREEFRLLGADEVTHGADDDELQHDAANNDDDSVFTAALDEALGDVSDEHDSLDEPKVKVGAQASEEVSIDSDAHPPLSPLPPSRLSTHTVKATPDVGTAKVYVSTKPVSPTKPPSVSPTRAPPAPTTPLPPAHASVPSGAAASVDKPSAPSPPPPSSEAAPPPVRICQSFGVPWCGSRCFAVSVVSVGVDIVPMQTSRAPLSLFRKAQENPGQIWACGGEGL